MFYNIDSIFERARIALSRSAYTLRESEQYRSFTERFLCSSGDLILSNFHGIDIEYKARVKSPESTKNKIKKHALEYAQRQASSKTLVNMNEFNLYDIYGGKIVVISLSDNFYSKFITIDGFLSKRKKYRDCLAEAKANAAKFPKSEDKKEIVRLNHIIYREFDSMCQRYVSDAICDFIIHNPTLKKEFGLSIINNRIRKFNNKNEYIARHITLTSNKLPGWYMELQFKNLADYQVARTGDAAHYMRDGKSIDIPSSLEEINENTIPEYMVYVPEGRIYIPTMMERLYHHLEPVTDSKTLAKLFINMPDDQTGTFKKF